jgi:hypothetical protein
MLYEVMPYHLCDLMSLPIVGQILFIIWHARLANSCQEKFKISLKSDKINTCSSTHIQIKINTCSSTHISAHVLSLNELIYYQNEKWLHPVHFLQEVLWLTIHTWLFLGLVITWFKNYWNDINLVSRIWMAFLPCKLNLCK